MNVLFEYKTSENVLEARRIMAYLSIKKGIIEGCGTGQQGPQNNISKDFHWRSLDAYGCAMIGNLRTHERF